MTFKIVELPVTIYLVFDNDQEYYDGVLTEITNIDVEEDICTFVIEDLAPIPSKCKVMYSKLDSTAIHYDEAGIHIFLSEEDAKQWISEHSKNSKDNEV